MNKGHLQRFIGNTQNIIFFCLLVFSGISLLLWMVLEEYTDFSFLPMLAVFVFIMTLISLGTSIIINRISTKPLSTIARAVYHLNPNSNPIAPPNLNAVHLGRELTTSIVHQIYDLASNQNQQSKDATPTQPMLDLIKMPIIGIDREGYIKLINSHALKVSGLSESPINKKFSEVFNMDEADNKISEWLTSADRSQISDSKSWSRVGLTAKSSSEYRYYDLSASYSKHSFAGTDTLLCFFDQVDKYSAEEDSFGFIALAVHELRTPLTILRGYTEVLEEESSSNPQMHEYVQKMRASVDNMAFFVSNILNVAKFDKQEIKLTLSEVDWVKLLEKVISETSVRAEVYGKKINLNVSGDLPKVGADPVTITEVLVNLIDNAIKYSAKTPSPIDITAKLTNEGMIETIIKDQGDGIPESVMPHIFEKFSRNHHNKARVAGTGLGLYICRAIINAHKGVISARSKEGEGSEFTFTLHKYSEVASQNTDDATIMRNSHGWIKNHNLNRS